ncbi:uncharacterized protein BCR38DRAFT_412096 [Pseudomassariella vexata]|uniref:Major facilitator superfamily domain-containing protein n=1 Tax=Pseudomassariella vexata TaxID=1141098 RepID=A0A1Y2DP99_9PEZI|nr:uncharacterized protein BCR38DRAFT_412096 [Pseudomassariella vexata]ORY60999.1 hypothetical protein BCR38DRAFT_412096 [Pseudomassariella vexata]
MWVFLFLLAAQTAGLVGMPETSMMVEVWSSLVLLRITALIEPETLDASQKASRAVVRAQILEPEQDWVAAMKWRLCRQVRNARGSLAMPRNRSVAVTLVVFALLNIVGQGLGQTFLQHFSKPFHRTRAEAGYWLALRGALVVLVMGVMLSCLSKVVSSPTVRITAYRKDSILARGSATCIFISTSSPLARTSAV